MTLTESSVGKWVVRQGRWTNRFHRAQSLRNDQILTKCGKYMNEFDKSGNELTFFPNLGIHDEQCQICD